MKKIISTLLLAVMIVCCFANVAFASAAGDAAIAGSYVETDAGSQVTVSFTASNLEYVSYWFELNYDSSALEIVSISKGGATAGSFQANTGTGRIAAAADAGATANGTLFTVTFNVTDTAKVGDKYNVGLKVLEIRKQGGESVSPSVGSAAVEIVCDHEYEGVVTTPATCAAEGVKTYTCKHCGDSYTEAVAKLDHEYVGEVTIPATCAAEGVKTFTCKHCGDSYTEAIAKLDHEYVGEVTTPATCAAEGVKTFICKHCGDSYTEAIAKVDHKTAEAWEHDKDYHWHACSECKAVMDKAEHVWIKVVDKNATATKDGYGHYECEDCERVGEEYTIPATGEELDDVPSTGDITGLIRFGVVATLGVMLGIAALVINRKKFN